MALVCSGCQQPLISDARFCPNCGTPVCQQQSPLAAAAATGLPICGSCGIIAPLEHAYCSVCDAALGPQRLSAPGMPDGSMWASISLRFECRACRQLAPLNHLDVDGLVKCMHCGVEQRFDVTRWQNVIGHVHQIAERASQPVAAWGGAGTLDQSRASGVIGKNAAFVTSQIDGLEVRVSVGHPLCEKCSSPVNIAGRELDPLAIVCPKCNAQRTYVLPSNARQQFPRLQGVVCAEHELGRREVQTEVGAGGSVAIRCGNCSAPLPISDGKSVIHCPFCGVACRITPDTLWRLGNRSLRADWWWLLLERPSSVAQPNQPEWEHAVYARLETRPHVSRPHSTSTSTGPGCAFVMVLLVLGVGVGAASYVALRKGDGANPVSLFDKANPVRLFEDASARWNSLRTPAVYDVNRDGVFDVIGQVRTVTPNDTIRVAAFDGATGKNLWRSEVVGSFSDAGTAKLQIAADTLLLPLEGGRLRAFALSDGSSRFDVKLHENIERFCGSTESGFVLVETKDNQQHLLALSSGAIRSSQAAGLCPRIERPLPELVTGGSMQGAPIVRDHIEGMSSNKTVRLPDSDLMLALGEKRPGTRIPRVAAFRWQEGLDTLRQVQELEDKLATASARERSSLSSRIGSLRSLQANSHHPGKPEVSWIADVPGVDPLTTSEGSVDFDDVDVHGDTLVVSYGLKAAAHRYRLTAFSVQTGRRLWDTDIDDSSPYSGLKATPHYVFVSRWDGLYAFAIATGRLVYKIR